MKISIAGVGFVGLFNTVLLAQSIDILPVKVAMHNRKQCSFEVPELAQCLAHETRYFKVRPGQDRALLLHHPNLLRPAAKTYDHRRQRSQVEQFKLDGGKGLYSHRKLKSASSIGLTYLDSP